MLTNRLQRITRDGRWIPEIDGLRFLAIASVMTFHIAGELGARSGRIIPVEYWWFDRILTNFDRGVVLFFVISGMILAMPFARHYLLKAKPVSLRKYYLRRLTRLEPPYLASLLLIVAMVVVYQHGLPPGYVPHILATAFYQHNIIYGEMSPVNPVTWSLEVEIQFYLLAPFVMQLFRIPGKPLRRTILIAAIVAVSLAQMPFNDIWRFHASILGNIQYFLAGLLMADVFVLDLESMPSSWLWDIAGLAALAAALWISHGLSWVNVVLPIILCILFLAAMRSYAIRRFLANRWVAVTGGMCYSIYLLHFILVAVLFKVTKHFIIFKADFPTNLAIQLVTMGLPILAMCAVFFALVERPCMDPAWPSKLWHRLTGRRESEAETLDTAGVAE